MKKFAGMMLFLMVSVSVYSQGKSHYLRGQVFETDLDGNSGKLAFASIFWLQSGTGVLSDSTGTFVLHKPHDYDSLTLIVSYVGYQTDTISIRKDQKEVDIYLRKAIELKEVRIKKNQQAQISSRIQITPTQIITEAGLQKLACCNIGESFESNATIDAGFTDALSGAKKIRMLGLDGKYSQFLFENIPFMRGPESGYGLSHIPGPFMESIQVSKGTSSVLNGYESTTGQINVEYKKPEDSELFYLNLFANTEGRYESNLTSAIRLNEKLHTGFFFHASRQNRSLDKNDDGFYDKPLTRQLNFLNRWDYKITDLMHLQLGVEFIEENRIAGQLGFRGNTPQNGVYGSMVDISRFRVFGKVGWVFQKNPNQSLGWIHSYTWFNQESFFGNQGYEGRINNYYSNFIFQTYTDNEQHKLSSGLSFLYDDYSEFLMAEDLSRREIIPGIFAQYTWDLHSKSVLMTGLRLDHNSLHGLLFTPRIHWKYTLNEYWILRSSLGKAYRSASVLSENLSLMASSRSLVFKEEFSIEEAWNCGLNLSRYIYLKGQRGASFSIEYYRTDFLNQVITDLDQSTLTALFYNLKGRSYSNSFQAELNGEFLPGLDMTLAYRFNDVKVEYLDEIREKPFVYRHKGLITSTYSTPYDKWSIDFTFQYNGKARIPDTSMNPTEYQRSDSSPGFVILHSQVTKKFKNLDIYIGIENITNYKQKNPVISSENPFGEYFDASLIWGPLTGRMFYGGLRFSIQ